MEAPRGVVDLNFLKKIDECTKKPEIFLGVQEGVAKELTTLLKGVYDFTKTAEAHGTESDALPELIIQDFDEEQIWQELELQNDFKVTVILSDISRLIAQKEKLDLTFVADTDEEDDEDEGDKGTEKESNDDKWENDDFNSNDEMDSGGTNNFNCNDEEGKQISARKGKVRRPVNASIVDDTFFKLDEMAAFLDKEDRKDAHSEKDRHGIDDESDSESDEIDLFEDIAEDEDRVPKYSDFFPAPDSDEDMCKDADKNNFDCEDEGYEGIVEEDIDENADSDEGMGEHDIGSDSEGFANKKKKVRFDLSGDNDPDEFEEPESNEIKSQFEISQERLRKKISHLETAAMSEKQWQLKGEVGSSSRPQDSLMEEVVDFQMTTRPAPIITEATTLSLEHIIRERVIKKQWNNVHRQVKTADKPNILKKRLVLNEEKSKLGLAEVYEQDYLAKLSRKSGKMPKENEEREDFKEIKRMMASLFTKLDALANYHFTPKPAVTELRVITNTSAVSMEEVAPVAATSASLLAPEEVKAKLKGDLMSKAERTSTDKKRERRHKKATQHFLASKKAKKAKLFETGVQGIRKNLSKKNNKELVKDVTKSKNVSEMKISQGVKITKSSTSFFQNLQDKVKIVNVAKDVEDRKVAKNVEDRKVAKNVQDKKVVNKGKKGKKGKKGSRKK